jgi:hypothetical protein
MGPQERMPTLLDALKAVFSKDFGLPPPADIDCIGEKLGL